MAGIPPLTILLVVGGIVIVALIIGVVIATRSERDFVDDRMEKYVTTQEEVDERQKALAKTPLTSWLNKRVEKSAFGSKMATDLARADLKIKPGEYIAVIIIAIIGLAGLGYVISGQSIFGALAGGVIGLWYPGQYVKSQQKKRLIKFNDQLADMLNLMVNGLRAGFSTMQAMEAVSRELPPPISDEFMRVVQEMQLGVPMERSLANLLGRIPSDYLDLVITAINVQREVGGNLAEILDTISYTIRERVRIKGEIRVMVSQVMYSGKFLAMMPLFVIGILYLLNRDYIMTFFDEKSGIIGYIALGLAATLIVSGYLIMTKIADIEV